LNITSLFFKNIFKKLDFTQLFRKAFEFQIKRAQRNNSILDEIRENLEKDCVMRRLYASLAPFIDAKNIIRSRSRLAQIAYLPYDTKFPIILTPDSYFTRLLVKSYHFKYEHSVGRLKDTFYIIGLGNLLRKIQKQCFECGKKYAIPLTQQISDLPRYRFTPLLREFAKTGLDFAGPFKIKVGRA
jgi:hypothetical protein